MINISKTVWSIPSPKILGLALLLTIFIILAGFFAYQWWQIKGELERQIIANKDLTKQIDELQAEIDKLQKEIEEIKATEKVIDEIAGWRTYRNEEYGFEIDYPVGWEIENFIDLNHQIFPECLNYNCKRILENSFECLELHGLSFEKKIITKSGAEGCQGKRYEDMETWIIFPLKNIRKVKVKEEVYLSFRNLLILHYISFPESEYAFSEEEIKIFNQIASTFRFIGE